MRHQGRGVAALDVGRSLLSEDTRETLNWRRPMKRNVLGLAGIAVAISAVTMSAIPAVAHHSFAMFDAQKSMTLEGTVKEFQWTNPHAWILLNAPKEGAQVQWAIEMNGPTGLARTGWLPKTLTPGMP